MNWYCFDPVDTLFFRDTRPFNSGEGGNLEAVSSFPPSPRSATGMLKSALARAQGWRSGDWDQHLVAALNESTYYRGPYLQSDAGVLFSLPTALLESSDSQSKQYVRLAPYEQIQTDLGLVWLCTPPKDKAGIYKEPKTSFVTQQGLQAFLDGAIPSTKDVIAASDLWASETRVGISRNTAKRTTEEAALYQVAHTRPKNDLCLVVGIHKLPKNWEILSINAVGGEGRMASVQAGAIGLPQCSALEIQDGVLRYTVVLLTPLAMHDIPNWRNEGTVLGNLPGKLVSACVGKPVWIGGWETRDQKSRPIAAAPHFAAGTVFFIEAQPSDLAAVRQQHGMCISSAEQQHFGFGQIVIGTWRKS